MSTGSRKHEQEETSDELTEPFNKRVASLSSFSRATHSASSSRLAPPSAAFAGSKPAKPVNAITPPSAESTCHEVALFCYFVQRPTGIVENAEGHLSIQHLTQGT